MAYFELVTTKISLCSFNTKASLNCSLISCLITKLHVCCICNKIKMLWVSKLLFSPTHVIFCHGSFHILQKTQTTTGEENSTLWEWLISLLTVIAAWCTLALGYVRAGGGEQLHLVKRRHKHKRVCSDEYFNSPVCCECFLFPLCVWQTAFTVQSRRKTERKQIDAPTTQLDFLFDEKPQEPVTQR